MELLYEQVIDLVAKKRRVNKKTAVNIIDQCLKKISSSTGISYKDIYSIFHNFYSLATCLSGECSKITLDKCEKMCHCVIFKGKCAPRYIPEAPQINNDPDKWILGIPGVRGKIPLEDLQNLVEYASYLYYNYDGGGLTDNSFDALWYYLNKYLKTRGRRWEKIGAEPIEKLRKKLPYPMPSLEKIKPNMIETQEFIAKAKTYSIVWSEKLDGVSGLIIFKDGEPVEIYTRGDGNIGGDVTYLKDYIKLPRPTISSIVVRGEFILKKTIWNEKYAGTYSNPRSFVAATINSGHVSTSFIDLDFVAYQIVDWSQADFPSPLQTFQILKKQGFLIPGNGIFKEGEDLLLFEVIETFRQHKNASAYNIDGLVLSLNLYMPLDSASQKAFKMTFEEQLRTTRVIDIDWSITRYGRYIPIAVFEAVYIDGIRLHRASAYNAKHVEDWRLGIGTNITVTRSGDVIPIIKDVKVDDRIKTIMPPLIYPWHWTPNHVDILLDDIESNKEVQIKRLLYFFETIQTPGVGIGRVRRLYDAGFTTIKLIASAKQEDLLKIRGFGPKLSKTIYTNIHETMRKTRLDRYFIAITTFRTSVGRTLLKSVLQYYPQLFTSKSTEIVDYLKKHKIPGIGPKRVETLATSIPQFMKILMDINKDDISYAISLHQQLLKDLKKGYNPKIKGDAFVMTGFIDSPDYDLEDYIWDHHGSIKSMVTPDVTAIVSANITNITTKMMRAYELKIPVYTLQEFIKAFDIPIKVKKQADSIIPEEPIEL